MVWRDPLLVTVLLLFPVSSWAGSVYRCSTPEGKRVYSDSQCANDAEKIRVSTAANGTPIAPGGNDFIGTWKRHGFRYFLSAGGSLRTEESYGGKLLIWRTGTWSVNGKEIEFHFTRYGGPGAGVFGGGDAMDYVERGEYKWKNVNSFSARVGGLSGQSWDTFARVGGD